MKKNQSPPGKKKESEIFKHRVFTWSCELMKWALMSLFCYAVRDYFVNDNNWAFWVIIFSSYFSFKFWELKYCYHKYLIDIYISIYENHPLKNKSRSLRREAIRAMLKNPIVD